MKKCRVIESKDKFDTTVFKPQYYRFFTWWDFTYDNVIGGCDLGMSSTSFEKESHAYDYITKHGYIIADDLQLNILTSKEKIQQLEKDLETERAKLTSLENQNLIKNTKVA
jgi:hypothetical protein